MNITVETKRYALLAKISEKLSEEKDPGKAYGVYYTPSLKDYADSSMTLNFIGLSDSNQCVNIPVQFTIDYSNSIDDLLKKIVDVFDQYLSAYSGEGEVLMNAIEYLYDSIESLYESPVVFREDKQKICDALCAALQATRGAYDLIELRYSEDSERGIEIVSAVFAGGSKKINVSMDSGTAMIRDIVTNIGC